jgi:FecR protein
MQDEVKTTKGKVGITFQDNTQVQVNENSRLVIDDFVYDPKSTKGGKLAVNVASGTVRYASGQIAKNNPQAVAVNTPTATIGVRGTDFTATVDELGASTIILLPSCPYGWIDVARDCKTGEISVTNDAGSVILNRPFQATKVETRGSFPTKPVIVNLVPDAINNMLIVAPPKELKEDKTTTRAQAKGALDVDFLKETGLVNAFDLQQKEVYQNKLDRNFLNQDFLANILDIVNAQLAAQLNLLNTQKSGLLPDYVATTGVTVEVDDLQVTLCRNDGSNQQCVTTPKNQNSTIYQQQGSVEIKNRVNNGGGTTITLRQN